jgi:hypothetical protein
MFGYGKSDYEEFSNIIEETFAKYNKIKTLDNFIECFPKYKLEEKLTKISRAPKVIEMEDDEETFELDVTINFLSYQILWKLFYVLFIEVENNDPFIVYFIPHSHYASWVKGEFRETVGEFSGKRGNLSSSMNPNAKATFVENNSTGKPIVVLHRFEKRFEFLNNLFADYFSNVSLEGSTML